MSRTTALTWSFCSSERKRRPYSAGLIRGPMAPSISTTAMRLERPRLMTITAQPRDDPSVGGAATQVKPAPAPLPRLLRLLPRPSHGPVFSLQSVVAAPGRLGEE